LLDNAEIWKPTVQWGSLLEMIDKWWSSCCRIPSQIRRIFSHRVQIKYVLCSADRRVF